MNSSELSTIISNTINEMFYNIFSSIDNSLYSLLDDFIFITPNSFKKSQFSNIFGDFSLNGILVIANSLILGYLIYYAFKLLFSYLGVTETERPSRFIFKLIICAICMNFSFFICDEIINIISLISGAIRQVGEDLFNTSISFSTLVTQLNSVLTINDNLNIFSLDGIIKSIVSIGLLNLLITYAVRFVLIRVFIILSPFAFLSLCNKNTSILFKSWFKSFLSLMLVQILVSIVLLIIFSINISNNNISSKLILMASIFILLKANTYVREMLGGISSDVNLGINNLKSMITK